MSVAEKRSKGDKSYKLEPLTELTLSQQFSRAIFVRLTYLFYIVLFILWTWFAMLIGGFVYG